MADVTITPANVQLSSGAQQDKLSLEEMVAGDVVFLSNAGTHVGRANAANATDAVIAGQNGLFVVLNSSEATGQPVLVAGAGTKVDFGAGVLLKGEFYALSPTLSPNGGKIKPLWEILTGEWISLVGYAETNAILVINPIILNFQKP